MRPYGTSRSPLLVMALFAGACSGDEKACETGDTSCDTAEEETEPYEGATTIDRVAWDCDETRAWYDVWTVGWTGGGELVLVDPGDGNSEAWTETHDLQHWTNDEYGYWEELYLELTILQEPACTRDDYEAEDACYKMWESGVNTLPLCDQETKDRMSWSVTVYDPDDPTLAVDCVAWGADPSQFTGCTAFEAE